MQPCGGLISQFIIVMFLYCFCEVLSLDEVGSGYFLLSVFTQMINYPLCQYLPASSLMSLVKAPGGCSEIASRAFCGMLQLGYSCNQVC